MSAETPFVFVTGNLNKLREAERILGYRPLHERLELPEIQSLDLVEVLRAKADEAWRRVVGPGEARPGAARPGAARPGAARPGAARPDAARPDGPRAVVVDEAGLALRALGGFPGPLVKWMLKAVGPEGIARTAHRLGDPSAIAQCALIYRDAEGEILARGDVRGRLAESPRGDAGFGWDPIFVPEGQAKTYAQMSAREKDAAGHRGVAWRRILAELSASRGGKL